MAAVVPDPRRIKSFKSAAAFEKWLARHHDEWPELWLKIHKKDSGLPSVTAAEALDVALCWGWIDGLRKGFDERSFLQRYTPRRAKSVWSQVNKKHVARLTAAGRMTEHGRREIDAAKKDGRWDEAYAPMASMTVAELPKDLRAAIDKNARAKKMLSTLNRMNLFALAFRVGAMKTAAGRERKIQSLVEMLARGETIAPNPTAGAGKKKAKRAVPRAARSPRKA